MPDVIHWQHDRAVVRKDHWRQLGAEQALPSLAGSESYLLPLPQWLHLRREAPAQLAVMVSQARVGVWLMPDAATDSAITDLLPSLQDIALLAIQFPTLADGRGYSLARQLRTHHGYQGELRAVGDITRDQLLFLVRCGFDSICLRAGADPVAACAALTELPSRYQDEALPGPDNARRWSAALEVLYQALEGVDAAPYSIALASSLSVEDMVLTDLILRHELAIEIFTLDTGRLHADTLALMDAIEQRYGYRLRVLLPQPTSLAVHIREHGNDSFYKTQSLRRACCHLRKVEPLQRALQGKRGWITGQRREQAVSRSALGVVEHDADRNIPKYNPLADWTEQAVWDYIQAHEVPVNRLYAQGYRSIGCAPCTRPTLPHEPARAGRWWWESQHAESHGQESHGQESHGKETHSECGLHLDRSGRLVSRREG
jgi:phosphoadenosine phosphosulfate reductase